MHYEKYHEKMTDEGQKEQNLMSLSEVANSGDLINNAKSALKDYWC